MKRRLLSCTLVAAMLCGLVTGCTGSEKKSVSEQHEDVTLTVTGGMYECEALEKVAGDFAKEYPWITVNYEFMQNYEESLSTRLSGDDKEEVDLFFSNNLQVGSSLFPYALDLYTTELDVSDNFEGLVDNFELPSSDTDQDKHLYCMPLGGEVRGMYVNKTLLGKFGIEVPKNREELIAACEQLKQAGYIPLEGNPSFFAQELLYPYVCNLIANSDKPVETYEKVNSCENGISKMFEDPLSFLYMVTENKYYDYKTVEIQKNRYTNLENQNIAMDFLNIVEEGDSYAKKDDVGEVAFMPYHMSFQKYLDEMKENYHSNIEYEFILAPVTDKGGYAYLSPSDGMAINKKSLHLEEAELFLNYLSSAKHNEDYNKINDTIPNTKDALDYVRDKFDIPEEQISQLGQVTFDYIFYNVIGKTLIEVSKANNPKYMKEDGTMYEFSYYMDQLEEGFAEVRSQNEESTQ